MFFQSLDLTTAQRPALLSEETLLFVQDAVGLYDGYELTVANAFESDMLADRNR